MPPTGDGLRTSEGGEDMQLDENTCDGLQEGGFVVFEDDPGGERYMVTRIDRDYERVFFISLGCLPTICPGMTRCMKVVPLNKKAGEK